MDPICCCSLANNSVVVFAGDRRDDAWLSICALVNKSKQIQNAQQVENAYDDPSNQTKQLYVAVKVKKEVRSVFIAQTNLREEENHGTWKDDEKCCYDREGQIGWAHLITTF